jgi:hypothetical protein
MEESINGMFKLEELSGTLIKSGRFKEAVPVFSHEIRQALAYGILTEKELFEVIIPEWSIILLNPSNFDQVQKFGNMMLQLALRIPNKLPRVSHEEFDNNVKKSREA